MTQWRRSLAVRQALYTGAWVAAGLVVMWFWVTSIITDSAQRTFDARLVSLADSLMASAQLNNAIPYLSRPVSEPRFDRPLSGVYFQIEGPNGDLLTSHSLGDRRLPHATLGHNNILFLNVPGPQGQLLRLAERDIIPEGAGGTMHVLVAADIGEVATQIAEPRRLLAIGFTALGLGLLGAVMLQVWAGLTRLRRLRLLVADLRAGGQIDPEEPLPNEVASLVEEIAALVGQNRATVERARSHVGNLAHALRTKLSIMRTAVAANNQGMLDLQLAEADRLVQHHLVRARTAALVGIAAADLAVVDITEDVARAMRALFAARGLTIEVSGDASLTARCEREDLLEMLGNLLENACKFGRTQVLVAVEQAGGQVAIAISDDGPGVAVALLERVRARGVRADEAGPGSGLGLAITADIAALYSGNLELVSPGRLGGLTALVTLPSGRKARPAPPAES